ncbi:MAG: PqqD family peptide modification chaperone, partial [Thermodesulfobacteriota bacterium]|nr:PqqD family peptide modification chaperone [Thermodesulfobacteriota bacterium]
MMDMTGYDSDIFYMSNPDVSTRLIGDGQAVIYEPDTDREKFLNPTGFFVWERLNGSYSVREISDEVYEGFASAPYGQTFRDVSEFILDLSHQGFASKHETRLPGTGSIKIYPGINDSPESVDISITGECNLHCRYCFYAEEMKFRQDLPAEQWVSFFKELGQLSV